MDEKRAKQTQALTSELILSTAGVDELSAVTSFKFKSGVKLRAIESLSGCINLQELDLSYHLISRIEGLDGLSQLRDLNLAENNIRKLENLEPCKALEVLNLTGNQIKELPRSALEPLQKLRILKLARNRISSLPEVSNLSLLCRLEVLAMHGNPVESEVDFQLFVAYHVQSLKSLEGSAITQNVRSKAQRKFSPQSMEAWAVRENLVSYRRTLSDLQQRRRNIAEEATQTTQEIASTERDQHLAEEELERTNKELHDVEHALEGRSNDQFSKKKQKMRELIMEAERLRDESLGMQKQIAENRDCLVDYEKKLRKIRGSLADHPESMHMLSQERHLLGEIDNLSRRLEGEESQYGQVVDQLSSATEAISVLEEEIIGLKESRPSQATPRWLEDSSVKPANPSKSYPVSIDYNTEMYLIARQDQIKSKLPQLKAQLINFQQRLRLLRQRRLDLDEEQRRTDEQIASFREKINECEIFLQKGPPSPVVKSSRNGTKMWESLKSMMSSVSGADTSMEEMPAIVTSWPEHIKERSTPKPQETDPVVQLSAQQRIDQATIMHLQQKLAELKTENERLKRHSPEKSPNQDVERLNQQFKKQSEELEWACEQVDKVAQERDDARAQLELCQNQVRELKVSSNEAKIQVEEWKEKYSRLEAELDVIVNTGSKELSETQAKISKARMNLAELQAQVRQAEMKTEMTEEEYQMKLKGLKKNYYDQTSKLEEIENSVRRKEIQQAELQRTLEKEQGMAENLADKIEELRKKKREEEDDLAQLQAQKSVVSLEKAAIRQVAEVLGIRGEVLSSKIEEVLADLERKIEKASRFKKNKEKFLEMYEASTQDLKSEWDVLNTAKNEMAQRQAQSEADLAALQNQRQAVEDQIHSLKQKLASYEQTAAKQDKLKEQLSNDWRRVNQLVEEESQKRNDIRAEVEELTDVVMELRDDRKQLEDEIMELKATVSKYSDRKTTLDSEIRGHEEMCRRLAQKMSDEEVAAREELLHVGEELKRKRRVVEELDQHRVELEERIASEADRLHEVTARREAEEAERRTVKDRLKATRDKLREFEKHLQDGERALGDLQREIDERSADFESRDEKLAQLDKQIEEQRRELDHTINLRATSQQKYEMDIERFETMAAKAEQAERKFRETQVELDSLRVEAQKYNKQVEALGRAYDSRQEELALVENDLADWRQKHKNDVDDQQRIDEEIRLKREVLGSLDAKIKGVEAKKAAVIEEISKLSQEFAAEEKRHNSKLQGIKASVVKAENVLAQLRGGVETERLRLAKLEEDRGRTEDYMRELLYRADEAAETAKLAEEQCNEAKQRLVELREAEDTAIVLLAVSGHKIDARVKERITYLVRSASELQALKENISPTPENRPTPPPYAKHEEKRPDESMMSDQSQASSVDFNKLVPETEELKKLLANLEATQQRLRALTPLQDMR